MKCPVDETPLALSERSGIEIDYCPQCRGIWLDRGELDKILERAEEGRDKGAMPGYPDRPGYPDQRGRHGGGHGNGHGGYDKRRRGGWLGELFD